MADAIWIDATNGAAGDMLLGALLDAGAPLATVEQALLSLGSAGIEPIGILIRDVRRHGLRGTRVEIEVPPSQVRRGLGDILELLARTALSPAAHAFAAGTFQVLAEAEAQVHGIGVEAVHFHEIGALDSIADIVGCAVALDELGLLAPTTVRTVSEVALGSGSVQTEHGALPVPVPATLRLLTGCGAPVTATQGSGELCTPTGAALLRCLADGWGPLPPMSISATGTGAGKRDPADRPNITRVVIGDRSPATNWRVEELTVLEATVDDLDPRLWPEVLAAVHGAGANDAWLTAVAMRHGRPGFVITVLTAPATLEAVLRALVSCTTTLGVRTYPVARRSLPRDVVTVDIEGQWVQVKRGLLDGMPVTLQPEYSDARAAARALGLPTAEVIDRAREAARHRGVGPA